MSRIVVFFIFGVLNTKVAFGFNIYELRLRYLRFFFFFLRAVIVDFFVWTVHTSGSRALFMEPTNLTFQQPFFIKNGSHDTIHTFKNYFTTVFSDLNCIQMDPKYLPFRTPNASTLILSWLKFFIFYFLF